MTQSPMPQQGLRLSEFVLELKKKVIRISVIALGAGLAALGITSLIPPKFTAKTSFLPPQSQQSSASLALNALSGLSGLAGGLISAPADQYIGIIQSETIGRILIEKHNLRGVFDTELMDDTLKVLDKNTKISVGRKDGIIILEYTDTSPERAAEVANSYVKELRDFTTKMSLTEAQQRRAFYEKQLAESRPQLELAQNTLERSGINPGSLKLDPRTAATSYARLQAEQIEKQILLDTLLTRFTRESTEVREVSDNIASIKRQLDAISKEDQGDSQANYTARYRDFKYQEILYELFSKQYEAAKMDERREGNIIQPAL